jgi:hypothetical protein
VPLLLPESPVVDAAAPVPEAAAPVVCAAVPFAAPDLPVVAVFLVVPDVVLSVAVIVGFLVVAATHTCQSCPLHCLESDVLTCILPLVQQALYALYRLVAA